MPKSTIFTLPSSSSRTFAGFTSRWTTPRLCAKSRPRQMSTATFTFCWSVSRSWGTIAWARSMPSSSSMAM